MKTIDLSPNKEYTEQITSVRDDWSSARLKHVSQINPDSISGTPAEDWEIEYVDISSVNDRGEIEDTDILPYAEAPSRAQRIVQDGDTIISTVRPYLRAISLIESPPDNLVISTGFGVVRPDDEFYPPFLRRVLQADPFINWIVANSNGVSYPAIAPSRLGDLAVPIPSYNEQKKICDYIDYNVGIINDLIDEQQNLINLLEEKEDSLLTKLATQGLNENSILKDSDIPTFDDIPAHWEVKPNRAVFEEVDRRSENGSEELLSVSENTGVTPRSEKDVNMFEADSYEDYKIVEENDLVINTMWAWKGAVGISPCKGIVSPSYHVYSKNDKMLPEFADLFYRSPPYVSEMERFSQGVWKSRNRLYPDVFLRMKTILPPIPEQRQIVESFKSEESAMKNLKGTINGSIELLEEKKRAIITETVTGEIDIRDWEKAEKQVITR